MTTAARHGSGRGIPSATHGRFAILAVVLASSTGAIYGYVWQLSQAGLQARVQACLAGHASLPVAEFVRQVTATARGPVQLGDCVRPAGPSLVAWSLAGVAALAAVTLLLYWASPWWITRGGLTGRGRLAVLDGLTWQKLELDVLCDRAGLDVPRGKAGPGRAGGTARRPPAPEFLADAGEPRHAARAFGRAGQPQVRLSMSLVTRKAGDPELTKRVLHELGHVVNEDLRPTYLAIAAGRAFCVVVPAGYVAALAITGARPVLPDLRTTLAAAVLAALAWLSIRAASRSRELEADATAEAIRTELPADYARPAGEPPAGDQEGRSPRWQFWSWAPPLARRAAALRDSWLLYRPDSVAMFCAGVATAVLASEVTPAVFAVVLSSGLGGLPALASLGGMSPIELIAATFGPAVLITAAVTMSLACAAAWRLERRARLVGSRAGGGLNARLAVPLAAGMVAGIPLSADYAMAGTSGIFDSGAGRVLIVAGISALVLTAVVLAMFRWASECAAAWYTADPRRARLLRTGAAGIGAAGFLGPVLGWTVTSGLPLAMLAQRGPIPHERRLLGHWPAVAAIDAHFLPLGVWDILPGSAVLMALACGFVALGGARRAGPLPRLPAWRAPAAGLAGGALAVIAAPVLLIMLHDAIGASAILRAGGPGLLYFTRTVQLLVMAAGGLAAGWVARRSGRLAMTSAILTVLAASALAAPFVPRLLVVAAYGWHRAPVGARIIPVVWGDAGGLLGGRAVAAALLAAAIACALPRGRARGPAPRHAAEPPGTARPAAALAGAGLAAAGIRPAAATAGRLASALLLAAVLAGLAASAYFYITAGFSLP